MNAAMLWLIAAVAAGAGAMRLITPFNGLVDTIADTAQRWGERLQPTGEDGVEEKPAEGDRTAGVLPAGRGHHIWAGRTENGTLLRTPPRSAAIVVGPPRSGKTRHVIAPTLAFWDGPALITSTKGDILATAAARARVGPVCVYDPTGSLGAEDASVGFSPLVRCNTWDGAVEVAAALLSPISNDVSVRNGEHFATAARALLAPLFHAAVISGGGIEQATGWLGRMDLSTPAGILREAGAEIALQELSGMAAQAAGDYRTSVTGTAQVALAWAQRDAIRQNSDPHATPQISLQRLLEENGTLYVISPSRIQQELAPLIAALIDALCAHAIDTAIKTRQGRLDRPLLLALDEVANIAPVRTLPRLLSEGIQQGIVPLLGVQDMSQLRARYGEHETATMWSTPALRLILAGLADPYTARLAAEACGQQLAWRTQLGQNTGQTDHPDRWWAASHSDGQSVSYSQQREPLIEGFQLREMRPGEALALPQGRPAQAVRLIDGTPGMDGGCDWKAICAQGRARLCRGG